MLKKQDLGINPHEANNGSSDQSLTGIGGPRVTLDSHNVLRLSYGTLRLLEKKTLRPGRTLE